MTSPKPFGVYPPTNLNLQNLIKAQRNLAPSDFFFLVNWSYLLDVYAYDHNISVVGKPKLLSFYHFKRRETFCNKSERTEKRFLRSTLSANNVDEKNAYAKRYHICERFLKKITILVSHFWSYASLRTCAHVCEHVTRLTLGLRWREDLKVNKLLYFDKMRRKAKEDPRYTVKRATNLSNKKIIPNNFSIRPT